MAARLPPQLETLGKLAAALDEPVFFLGSDGRIAIANPAALELLAATENELLGRSFEDVLGASPASFPPGSVATSLLGPSGARVPVTLKNVDWRSGDGELLGRVLLARSRHAPHESSTKAAPRAESSRLASVSHEIRTPLNGILGLTELLLSSQPTPTQREYLEMIQTSGGALQRILNDILDLAKLEAGKIQLDYRAFSIRKLVREAVKMEAPRAHRKDLELIYDVDENLPDRFYADSGRLRQVLANLLTNAIKFTNDGEILASVELAEASEEDWTLRFSVSDTGSGIPASKQLSIFDSYAQGEGSAQNEGAGLGLAIASQLVERMEGKIWLERSEAKGSLFCFTAPLVVLPDGEEADGGRPDEVTGVGTVHILIVDDNASHRAHLARLLRRSGAIANAIPPERAADSAGGGAKPSLFLLDSRMPGVDSYSLARQLHASTGAPGILMTLSHETHESAVLRRNGLLGHLTKPIVPTHLNRAIAIVLRGASLQNQQDVQTEEGQRLPRLDGCRVLLAEDNPINRVVVEKHLQAQGALLSTVDNGRLVLEALEREPFDILLMDVQMPEMDGIEATRRIRERETERVPILALTAHARLEDRDRCLAAGMDGFLSKPFSEEDLLDAIAGLLRGRAPKREATQSGPMAGVTFDRVEALQRASGDEQFLAELGGLVVVEAPKTLEHLKKAIASGQAETVEQLAHRLKGSLLVIAAKRAAGIAQKIETLANDGTLLECSHLLEALTVELARLEPALRALAER